MKKTGLILMITALMVVGCSYKAPIAQKQNIKIDRSVLGLWQSETQDANDTTKVLVLEFTDTEYLIHVDSEDTGMYFRAYPIDIDGVSCIQTCLIGTKDGELKDKDKKAMEGKMYGVLSYSLAEDVLVFKTLNTNLVDDNLDTTEKLQAAFKDNANNENLFAEPQKLTRIEAE